MSSTADEERLALAHELRTPLSVIAGFAELLQTRDDDKTRLEASAQILEAVRRLDAAIERLLADTDEASVPPPRP